MPNPSEVAFSSNGVQGTWSVPNLVKENASFIWPTSVPVLCQGSWGHMVQGGPGEHAISSGDKSKHMMQIIDQKTWENP